MNHIKVLEHGAEILSRFVFDNRYLLSNAIHCTLWRHNILGGERSRPFLPLRIAPEMYSYPTITAGWDKPQHGQTGLSDNVMNSRFMRKKGVKKTPFLPVIIVFQSLQGYLVVCVLNNQTKLKFDDRKHK